MTQTRGSRKRTHQELEEDGSGRLFVPLSKRRDFNGQAELLGTNALNNPGHSELGTMERLQALEAAGGESPSSHLLTTSPKTSGAMISPSLHGHIPPHHHQQLHPTPCSPTAPHQIAPPHLITSHHASGSNNEIHHGMPNVPVSPAHSPQGFSNSLSSSHYNEINRILREAHFSRISRINGVELRPDELHL